jgi:chromosome segregation ATPase
MTNKPNVTSKYEEERLRAAEQSQIVYLQGQIDELRRLIKDQTNKYNWAMEQVRKVEAAAAQTEGLFERYRQEVSTSLDGYRRDIAVLRKEIAGALIKVEEGSKPLREMQTQIHQLGETRKHDRDQIAGWLVRIEELEQRTRGWQSQLREGEDRHRTLANQLEGLYAADEVARAEVRKVNEELQIEKQSLRRQAVEAQQLVADVRSIIDEHHSRIARLDEIRQYIELFTEQLPAQITSIEGKLPEFTNEIKRVERVSTERFLMNQERLEELRNQHEDRVVALQETDEQHLRQLTAWLERLDGWVRELEQRQARAASRLDQTQHSQGTHIVEIERRNVQFVEALATTLRSELERFKVEQVEQGRDSSGSAGNQ